MRIYVAVGLVIFLTGCASKCATSPTENTSEKNPAPTKNQSAQPTVQAKTKAKPTPVERKLAIQGMTCNGCAASVRAALMSVKGVHEASVSFEKGQASIKCDDSVTTADLIRKVENYDLGGVKKSYKARALNQTQSSQQTNTQVVERKLAIQGMCCDGCAARVRQALMSIKGVHEADVSFANGSAIVKCDKSVAAATLIDNLQNPGAHGGRKTYRVQELVQ